MAVTRVNKLNHKSSRVERLEYFDELLLCSGCLGVWLSAVPRTPKASIEDMTLISGLGGNAEMLRVNWANIGWIPIFRWHSCIQVRDVWEYGYNV